MQFAQDKGAAALVLHVATYNAAACAMYAGLDFVRLRTHLDFYTVSSARSPAPPRTQFDAYLLCLPLARTAAAGPLARTAIAEQAQPLPTLQWLWSGWSGIASALPSASCMAPRQPCSSGSPPQATSHVDGYQTVPLDRTSCCQSEAIDGSVPQGVQSKACCVDMNEVVGSMQAGASAMAQARDCQARERVYSYARSAEGLGAAKGGVIDAGPISWFRWLFGKPPASQLPGVMHHA